MAKNAVENNTKMVNRLLAAIEMMEFSILLMRQNIARQLPVAAPEQIDAELRRWLIDQPTPFVVRALPGQG